MMLLMKTTQATEHAMTVGQMFYNAVVAKCDSRSKKAKKAIDKLAEEFGRDRARMLAALSDPAFNQGDPACHSLFDTLSVAWVNDGVLLAATGHPRLFWLDAFDSSRHGQESQ